MVLVVGCGNAEPPVPDEIALQNQTVPLRNQNAVRCDKLMAELRALRDGPQPCEKADDCWVFHHGEHWDGCQVEVTKANNAILEKMRAGIEALNCPVDKGAMCATQEVKFCVAGGCGGKTSVSVKPADGVTSSRIGLDFEGMSPGIMSTGLIVGETAGRGTPAVWKVVEDNIASGVTRAFGTVENANFGRTFAVALVDGSRMEDLDLRIRVRAVAGKEDQGGGPVWRAVDADNYYTARWNPLEDNFRVYHVKDAERSQIATTKVKADPKAWHEIRIVMRGQKIEAWFDGGHKLEVSDPTFTEPGRVGFWVKADACTLFDDLKAEALSDAGTDPII